MPKKPTQAEKDAIAAAAAEAERIALEAEVKRIEDLRLKREEEVRLKMAAQIDFRSEEINNLQKQSAVANDKEQEILKTLQEVDDQENASRDWKKYVLCSSLPDATDESDVNTYISINLENLSNDFNQALDECAITDIVTKEVRKQMAHFTSVNDQKGIQKCYKMCQKLRETSLAKIDQATLYLIQQVDEFVTKDSSSSSSSELIISHQRNDNIKIGIWASLMTKTEKKILKIVHFKDIALQLDIPKPLNQLKVAIRISHLPYSAAEDSYECPHSTDFLIGGLINVDVIYLPPPPKQVKPQWTIRSTTIQSSKELQKLHFGEDHTSLSSLKVHIVIPESVFLISMSNLKVVIWDTKTNDWTVEGVQQDTLDYHADTRSLRFMTMKSGLFALAASRVMNLPYKNWSLNPALPILLNDDNLDVDQDEESCVHYTVETRYVTVKIQIIGTTCQLLEPQIKSLYLEEMAPGELLFALRDAGINLLPQGQDIEAVNQILSAKIASSSSINGEGDQTQGDTNSSGEKKEEEEELIDLLEAKTCELEAKVYKEMASVSAGFDLEASRWNRKIGNGRSVFQVRETSVFTGGNLEVEDYGMALIELDEKSQSFREAPDVGPIVSPGMKCSLIQQVEAKPIPSVIEDKMKSKTKSHNDEVNGDVVVANDDDPENEEEEEDESTVKGEKFNEIRLKNTTTYIQLEEGLKVISSEEAMERVSRTPPTLCRTVQRMLTLTRPISFS